MDSLLADISNFTRNLTESCHSVGPASAFDDERVLTSRGLVSLIQYSHYSLLATVEAIFNLGMLGRNDTSGTPILESFGSGIP
jgi:hypothetical protein